MVVRSAFADCLDRLSLMRRRFERALLLGCPSPDWQTRLGEIAGQVDTADPGPLSFPMPGWTLALDFPTSTPGLAPRVGLGLWTSAAATVAVEGLLFVAGLAAYARTTRPRDRAGTWGFWGFVAFLPDDVAPPKLPH